MCHDNNAYIAKKKTPTIIHYAIIDTHLKTGVGSQGQADYHSSSEKCSLFAEHNLHLGGRESIFNWGQLRQGTFLTPRRPWRTRK